MNHSIIVEKNIGFLVLNPLQRLSLLCNQIRSLSGEANIHDDGVDEINNYKYYDVEEMQTLKIPKNSLKKCSTLMHVL